jgi:hypothetical protein
MMTTIDDLATQVLRDLGLSSEPPIDVDLVARRLGVVEITDALLVEDGRLEREGAQTRILIRRGVRTGRRRFTVAHELAHLLLAEDTGDLVARRARLAVDGEERFCDQFAAALLLPRDWLRSRYEGKPRRLAVVRDVVTRADSSMAAAVIRLDEVLGWNRSLLRWRADQGRWRLVAGAGVPPNLLGEIGTGPTTRQSLDLAARCARGDVRLTLPLVVAGALTPVEAEVSIRNRTALALTALPGHGHTDSERARAT